MTEEQIKSLKKGDKFTIEHTIEKINGDEVYVVDAEGARFVIEKNVSRTLDIAALVTPPPTFEVGDTVRIVPDPLTGHAHNRLALLDYEIGKEYSITVIDMISGSACLDGPHRVMSLHCLELVKKAVEDKYIVEEDSLAWCVTDKNWSVCSFNKSNHPAAKAAAEEECARLNEAWRKQQEGGAE